MLKEYIVTSVLKSHLGLKLTKSQFNTVIKLVGIRANELANE